MNKAVLLYGGNLGDRLKNLKEAVGMTGELGEIEAMSSVYESEPWGFDSGKSFLNLVVILNTDISAGELLEELMAIEVKLGRKRIEGGYSSRTMDIDILFYNNENIENEYLIVPHPRLHLRRFTLLPLVELMPGFVHPLIGKSVERLLEECDDFSDVKIINSGRIVI